MLNDTFSSAPLSHSQSSYRYDVREALWDGIVIGLTFVIECFLLELLSINTVLALLRQKGGVTFYLQAVGYVLFNMVVFTPVVYAFFIAPYLSESPHSFTEQVSACFFGTVVQSIGYYLTHRLMHTPYLYWCHRFHHRFNTHICPVAANAVTPMEFGLAYALPFVAGTQLVATDRTTAHFFIWITGLTNLAIHTPALESLTVKWFPTWFVTTAFHFEHHRKLAMNYAAPTLNIDVVVRKSAFMDRLLARLFGKAYEENKVA